MKDPFESAPSSVRRYEQAQKNRDYSVYNWRMDAALEDKARKVLPHFPSVEEGDVIVDAGSGTGALAELVAQELPHSHVVALDINHDLIDLSNQRKKLTHLVFGDASQRHFDPDSVRVKYFSTSGHEVESFGGKGKMREAVKNAFIELAPMGRP